MLSGGDVTSFLGFNVINKSHQTINALSINLKVKTQILWNAKIMIKITMHGQRALTKVDGCKLCSGVKCIKYQMWTLEKLLKCLIAIKGIVPQFWAIDNKLWDNPVFKAVVNATRL